MASQARACSVVSPSDWTEIYVEDGNCHYAYSTSVYYTWTLEEVVTASGFGFTIPSDATIDGVILSIKHKASHKDITSPIRLVRPLLCIGKTGVEWSDNKNGPYAELYLTAPDVGGASDKWGLALTPAYVNHEDFAAGWGIQRINYDAVELYAYEDYLLCTVFYTPADPPPPPPPAGYGHNVIGVAASSIARVIGVETASISKVIGA
jgi:hypothetical protein